MERRNLFKLGLAALFPLPSIKEKNIPSITANSIQVRPSIMDEWLKMEAQKINQDLFMKHYIEDILGEDHKLNKQ